MNEQKIHELLQRYFDGETSLHEERELQQYFAQGEVPAPLQAYRPLFAYFAQERAVQPPLAAPKTPPTVLRVVYRRATWATLLGVAASIALLLLLNLPKAQDDGYIYIVGGQRVFDQAAAVKVADGQLQMLAQAMQTARSSVAVLETVHEKSSRPLHELNRISDMLRQEMAN